MLGESETLRFESANIYTINGPYDSGNCIWAPNPEYQCDIYCPRSNNIIVGSRTEAQTQTFGQQTRRAGANNIVYVIEWQVHLSNKLNTSLINIMITRVDISIKGI